MATSILIVKLSSLGDVLHTLPAAQAIRFAWPQAKLGWAVERAHAGVLRGQPWLDELIEWDRGGFGSMVDFVRRIRRTRWAVAIDFQGLFRSGLVTRLSRAGLRIGYSPAKELADWFYNDRVPLATMDRHAVQRSLDLAARVDARWPEAHIHRPYWHYGPPEPNDGPRLFPLHPSDEDRAAVSDWLNRNGFDPQQDRLVLLNPHCRKDANRWPIERFTALARRLLETERVRVAVTGGAASSELAEAIARPLGDCVWRADGRFSLLGSAELFSRADVLVTGDTGPMHLAVAVETPVVAIFGPANSLRTGPYASDAIVLDRRLSCAPCYARSCPLHYDPPLCVDTIGVGEVYQAVLQQLEYSVRRKYRPRRMSA